MLPQSKRFGGRVYKLWKYGSRKTDLQHAAKRDKEVMADDFRVTVLHRVVWDAKHKVWCVYRRDSRDGHLDRKPGETIGNYVARLNTAKRLTRQNRRK